MAIGRRDAAGTSTLQGTHDQPHIPDPPAGLPITAAAARAAASSAASPVVGATVTPGGRTPGARAPGARSAPVGRGASPCVGTPVDVSAVVRSFVRGAPVSDVVVERLVASATVREHVGGHLLWTMGSPASALMLIARGMVKLRRPLVSGEAVITGLFGPRDAIGLIAALDGRAYPTDAVALSRRVVIVSIPVQVLHSMATSDAALSRALMVTMASQARLLHEKILIASSGSVQARLALLLLRLADRYGDELETGETCIPIDLTRKTIAEFIEARVETVIRALSAWQQAGWVRTTADGIVIASLDRLRDLSQPQ